MSSQPQTSPQHLDDGCPSTIVTVTARLQALGYQAEAVGNTIRIYDTLVWWVWPTGEQLGEWTPSVLEDNGDTEDHWRWHFQPAANGPYAGHYLTECHRRHADVGDALLSYLRRPDQTTQVVYRSPADLPLLMEPTTCLAEDVDKDWWTAWHTGRRAAFKRWWMGGVSKRRFTLKDVYDQ